MQKSHPVRSLWAWAILWFLAGPGPQIKIIIQQVKHLALRNDTSNEPNTAADRMRLASEVVRASGRTRCDGFHFMRIGMATPEHWNWWGWRTAGWFQPLSNVRLLDHPKGFSANLKPASLAHHVRPMGIISGYRSVSGSCGLKSIVHQLISWWGNSCRESSVGHRKGRLRLSWSGIDQSNYYSNASECLPKQVMATNCPKHDKMPA